MIEFFTTHSVLILSIIALLVIFFAVVIFMQKSSGSVSSIDQSEETTSGNQVYVGNLSYRVREKQLREFFSEFEGVESLKIIKNHDTGRSKGFGFITFATDSQAQQALAFHGKEFEGRSIVVRIARPK